MAWRLSSPAQPPQPLPRARGWSYCNLLDSIFPTIPQVPSAALPSIQQRYRELQPLATATLCSLLQQLRGSLPQALAAGGSSAAGVLSLAGKALRGLRATLADANRLPEQQGMSSAAVVELLFGFLAPAQLAAPGSGHEEAAVAVAAAALDCTADLCSKFLGGAEASQQMLEVLLPKLQVGDGAPAGRLAGLTGACGTQGRHGGIWSCRCSRACLRNCCRQTGGWPPLACSQCMVPLPRPPPP